MSDYTPLTPPSQPQQAPQHPWPDPTYHPDMDRNYAPMPPAPKNNTGRILAFVAIAVLVLGVGLLLGWGFGKATAQAAPGTTPQSCLDALDAADEGFVITAEAFTAARDMLKASLELDASLMNDATVAMDASREKLNVNTDVYLDAKAACRAGS